MVGSDGHLEVVEGLRHLRTVKVIHHRLAAFSDLGKL